MSVDNAKTPIFSIVIPVYNRSKTIVRTLNSVKEQSFVDFECIVVDDGSEDGIALKAAVAGLDDPRFVYVWQKNGGACSARNRGIDLALGQFVAMLDSDDCFLPGKLQAQYALLRDGPAKHVVFGRMLVVRGGENFWIKPPSGPRDNERIDEYLMCTQGWIQSSTIALQNDLARQVRWNEMLPSSQDTDFAVRLASAGAKFSFIEQPIVMLDDTADFSRVSKQGKYKPLLAWIETMRGVHVSEKAYWAYRGWQCARVASYSNRLLGIRLFLKSAIRGVFSPMQALRIAAQILLPRQYYHYLIDRVVSIFGQKIKNGPSAN